MSEAEYNRGLRHVMQRNPKEVLLPTLQTGYSRVNIIYMAAALRRLPEEVKEAEETTPALAKKADPALRELWAERTRLFGEMNKMSNYFHECTTDAQRAENSKAILKKWDEIQAVKSRIAHYEKNGVMPVVVSDEEFPLPDDPIELMKKLASIRAMISQVQKTIREAADLPADHPDKSIRISEGEKRLEYLKIYKGHAETRTRQGIHN